MATGRSTIRRAATTAHARGRGRPRGGGLDLTADELLAAAEIVIERDGPGVTMADIAAASSVTKPSLYRIVGDRHALVAALSHRFGDRVNRAVAERLSPSDDARSQLRTIFRAYLRTVEEHRNLFLFISADPMGPDRIDRALDVAGVSAEPLATTLRRHGVSDLAAEPWSYAIVGAAQFATFHWLREGDRSADETADRLSDLVWSGVGAAVPDVPPDHHDRSHEPHPRRRHQPDERWDHEEEPHVT